MVAHLTRLLGPSNLDLAEETVQEVMLKAVQSWPYQGVPENPEAWLFRVAHNSAIDAVRRRRFSVSEEAETIADIAGAADSLPDRPDLDEHLRDEELRMIFMCCHPDLARDSSVALSLKTVGGFSVREIARAFLADDAAIAQRLVRAKRQIREQGVTLELPGGSELQKRLDAVLETIYFIFNEGYAAHEGDALIRHDLCGEALRLARLIADSPISEPRADALVALLAFQSSRAPARVDPLGDLILLEDQDRSRWDSGLIALGFHYFTRSVAGKQVSKYHAQAAIAATYARSATGAPTNWATILELYEGLVAIDPSPVVVMNRAVVVAKVRGAAAGLQAIEHLDGRRELASYYLLLALRGHLLLELGRGAEAADSFRSSLDCRCSEPERRFLKRKLEQCESSYPALESRA